MHSPRSIWKPALAAIVALAALALWLNKKSNQRPPSASSGTHAVSSRPVASAPPTSSLDAAFDRLPETPERDATLADLHALRSSLAAMPAAGAVAWIRGFLASGRDKPTGLSFVIASDGTLTEWPTFRSFLIDALRALDPAAAAEISREILSSPTTADEWALALRNVGRAEDASQHRDYLREKTEELIQNPAWQADPSIGYLNAFDVLVHTGATESTPLLSNLVQNKDRKDLAHAAFLTLDRLVQQEPAEMLGQLAADTALQQSRPEMTAQQFARADLRDERQREIVAQWLLDPARTPAELDSFAGIFPNHNQFVSNNLLTRDAPVSGSDLAAHDREVLEIVTAWKDDPAFQPVADHLGTIVDRLEQFTTPQDSR